MNLSIIIPCYNESDNVSSLQGGLFPVLFELIRPGLAQPNLASSVEVIFVDDGSLDDTLVSLKEAFGCLSELGICVRYERHEVNRGLGAALRTGFAASTGNVLITTDSDGTYKYSEIPGLLAYLLPEVDIVTASPYHPLGSVVGVPAHRLILSRGSSWIYRILVNRHIHTYTSLFRAYRCQVLDEISFESDGFLAGTELMVKAMFKGYHVAEYPIALYRRTYGVSKAKLARTILAHLRFQMWVLLYRLKLRRIQYKTENTGGDKWTQPTQSTSGADRK